MRVGLAQRLRHLPRWTPVAAGVALLAACACVVWLVAFRGGGASEDRPDPAVLAPAATATSTPVADIERLVIPAIGVDAPVTPKAVDGDGHMPSPDGPQDVVWYDFSAIPGLGGRPGAGNTILAGHVDYHGYGPAVFWDLRDVKEGDAITLVLGDGSEAKYATRSNRVVNPADTSFNEIVASTPEESLTVITCAGDFDPATHNYDMRRVVWAVRVG
jgi:LPXTG-site transpeptidase (sortase) family protein